MEFLDRPLDPLARPLGLIAVASRNHTLQLVQLDPSSGSMNVLMSIFDEQFSRQLVLGASALSPGQDSLFLLAYSGLVKLDLRARTMAIFDLSFARGGQPPPYPWVLIEVSGFFPSDQQTGLSP
eukprot:720328-Hanusia_phi.AAC.1